MNLSPGEQHAVDTVLKAGEMYGYGNMIAHLKTRWIEKLIKEDDFPEELAIDAADADPYPLK